jgi:hypothetical protein
MWEKMAGKVAQQEARAARCEGLRDPCFAAKTARTRPTRQGNTGGATRNLAPRPE